MAELIRIGILVPEILVKIWDENAKCFTREVLGEFLRMENDLVLQALAQREINRRCRNN